MKSNISGQKGLTLLELMVAMVIAGIVAAAMFGFQQGQTRSHVTQEALTDMQQNARAAMHFMTSEIRMAGCDPTGRSNSGIIEATSDSITFTMDIANPDTTDRLEFAFDGTGNPTYVMPRADGNISIPGEMISYSLNNGINLMRTDHQPDPDNPRVQELARNLDVLDFVYYDEGGDPITNPADRLNDIHSVFITVIARSGETLPGFMYRQRDTRTYSNQEGDVLLAANDNFRRIMLSTEVKIRNAGLN